MTAYICCRLIPTTAFLVLSFGLWCNLFDTWMNNILAFYTQFVSTYMLQERYSIVEIGSRVTGHRVNNLGRVRSGNAGSMCHTYSLTRFSSFNTHIYCNYRVFGKILLYCSIFQTLPNRFERKTLNDSFKRPQLSVKRMH